MPQGNPRRRGRESTRTNDQALGTALERVSDAVVALDRHWRYTYVNHQAASLFGRRPDDLIGRHIWTEFPEGVGQPFHLAYEKAMAEQVFVHMENYYEPWDRWFENRIYPSPDGISIFFHEITERKRAERSSRLSAELLEAQNHALEGVVQGAPLGQTLDRLLRVIEAQCPGMLCSVLLLDDDGVHMRHGASPSLPGSFNRAVDGQPIGPRAGSCGTAAFRREPVIVEDIATDPLWDDYRPVALAHDLRACWSTPILDRERRVLGTFALYFRTPGRPTPFHWQLIDVSTHVAAVAIVHDRESRELRASEERLRLAVTGGNVGIWEWDFATNRLVWNDELILMWGWPAGASDLTFDNIMSMVVAEDRSLVQTALARSVRDGTICDIEYRVRRHDAAVRWIAAKGRVEYDNARRPVRMMGVALDVTDRKHAEEALMRREAQLAEAQQIAHVGSYEWTVADNRVDRSVELCRIFGLSSEDFPATIEGYLARVHPDDRSATRTIIEQAFREGTSFDFEERIVRPDGAIRHLRSQGRWNFDEHRKPARLMAICQDVTDRKLAEEQLRRTTELQARNEELKAFAYTVSHDLKAPLRGIAGYAQELDRQHRTGLDERGLWCLKQIITATKNLDRLIEDLLYYSRLDVQTPSPTDVDLAAILDTILKDRKPVIASQGTIVSVGLSAKHLFTWHRGLLQVLANLIDNAIKYTRNAVPPTVHIGSEADPDRIRITVADNGIGFDMKYHDRIFGLFNRLVRQEDFEGTGAGLAIVKKVLDKMGGSVHAESSPGAGSTFIVELPLHPPAVEAGLKVRQASGAA